MPALQSIDVAVFRFLNGTLRNAAFDAIMPIFAGGAWFLPLVLLGGVTLIWKGGVRGRLCVLMLAMTLPMGDSITNGIKHAVLRPRPCLTLENVHLPLLRKHAPETETDFRRTGCSDSGSLPSAHATNWFAATVVAWIFYRRSWRFMLPLAITVAFSRVYNGVHYPGDVLAGAIIGAGYGAAFVLSIDALWRFTARRWFPLWWNALPSLIAFPSLSASDPESAKSQATNAPPNSKLLAEMQWLRLGYALIAFVFTTRLIYLASGRIQLSEDEAYQWLWSKHLALSYFSKPPLIAYAQWLGTHVFGDTAFGVRFFSPVCGAVGSLVALRFFAKYVSARAGFWLVAIFNTTPLLAVGSTLFTVDSLLVLFWTLAMFAGWHAVQPDATTRHWALVGLWMGLAFLSKYTALFQWICWAMFFWLWKPARVHLRRPGPYLALAINAVCALPVIIWNAQHDWVTAAHVANDARLDAPWKFDLKVPLGFFGGTFGLLNPVFFVATALAPVAMWKHRADDPLLRFFFAMGAPVFLIYAFYTLHSPVLLNWIAASIVPLFCLMVTYWERQAPRTRRLRAWLTTGVVLGAFAVVLMHETELIKKFTGVALPPRNDPLRRVRGWSETAEIVERERQKLSAEGKPVFVVGGHYGTTSILAFYTPRTDSVNAPQFYYRALGRPNSQFYFWPSYLGVRRGENAIYVQDKDEPRPPPKDMVKQFASVTEVGHFPVRHRGRVLRHVQVFACRDLLP